LGEAGDLHCVECILELLRVIRVLPITLKPV
jgi:hypothetical protein